MKSPENDDAWVVAEAERIVNRVQERGLFWRRIGKQAFVAVFSAYGSYGVHYLLDDEQPEEKEL